MTQAKLYSRAELATISGAPEDAVVFWLRNDLLRSEGREARQHRRFSEREVKLAALLREARSVGMNVAAMKVMIDALREAIAVHDLSPSVPFLPDLVSEVAEECWWCEHGTDAEAKALGHANRAELIAKSSFIPQFLDQGRITAAEAVEMVRAKKAIAAWPNLSAWWMGSDFAEGGGLVVVYRDERGALEVTNRLPQDDRLPAPSAVVFDLERVLDLRWPAELPEAAV